VTLDIGVLRAQIIEAAVDAVNNTADRVAKLAQEKAPVRKVTKGGRQTVRFKSAGEIEADRGHRARLGLAPEILATPEAIARVRAGRINPKSSTRIGGEEFGFARTIEHAGRVRSDITRVTPSGGGSITEVSRQSRQGPPRNFANRANRKPLIQDEDSEGRIRLVTGSVDRLTARGRYEFRTQRAASRQGRNLGGALRHSIHTEPAEADSFPIIKASVVAGGEDAPYAKYQELGTRHNAAHPFLRPALAQEGTKLPTVLVRHLRRLGR
jgi:HK97 gp10 family phage protein